MYILDIESFPNFFQIGLKHIEDKKYISIDIKNDEVFDINKYNELLDYVEDSTIITYNGLGFDNHLLSYIIAGDRTAYECHIFTQYIIRGVKAINMGSWSKSIAKEYRAYLRENYDTFTSDQIEALMDLYRRNKGNDLKFYQFSKIFGLKNYPYESIDLMKIVPSPASLKMYGAMMDMNIQELPYAFDKNLSDNEIDSIIKYNENDLNITLALYKRLKGDIELRSNLNTLNKVNTMNPYNDYRNKGNANLGLAILGTKMKIKKSKVNRNYSFTLDLPNYIEFEDYDLQNLVLKLRDHTFKLKDNLSIEVPKFLNIPVLLAGNKFTLGIGGLHTNEKSLSVTANDGEILRNIDVTSYYPNLIFMNDFAPVHLDTTKYIDTLVGVFKERVLAKRDNKRLKKLSRDRDLTDSEQKEFNNAKLVDATNKIVLNGGGFGKMGDKFSDTFDPKAMANITISGQLSLLMLVEQLDKIDGVTILSSNTDGIELIDREDKLFEIETAVLQWEIRTNLTMEFGEYKSLHARDVNNYVAVYNGYTKAKGAYAEPTLGKSITHKVVYRAIRKFLLDSTPLEDTILAEQDIKEFISIQKVTGGAIMNYTYISKNEPELVYKNGEIVYKVIPKSKRIKIEGVDIKEHCDKNPDDLEEYYFEIYNKDNPRTQISTVNGSQITHDGDNIGSTIRYYYTAKGSNINRAKSGDKVPNADNVALIQNIEDYDYINKPIDYDRYINIAYSELDNLGYYV